MAEGERTGGGGGGNGKKWKCYEKLNDRARQDG